jgi:hypothetical protein
MLWLSVRSAVLAVRIAFVWSVHALRESVLV